MAPAPPRVATASTVLCSLLIAVAWRASTSSAQLVLSASTICAACIALSSFYTLYLFPVYLSPLRHLPTVKGSHWLLGHFYLEVTQPKGHLYRKWIAETPNEGILRYYTLFRSEVLLATTKKALSEALIINCYDYAKPPLPVSRARDLLGDHGLVMVEGETHKFQRKVLNTAFSFKHIRELYPVFWRKSLQAAEAITAEIRGTPSKSAGVAVDFGTWSSRATLDIIGLAAGGIDFNSLANPHSKLLTTYQENFEDTPTVRLVAILATIFPARLVKMLPFKCNRQIATGPETVRGVSAELLAEKKKRLAAKEPLGDDILAVALQSGAFNTSILLDQIMTFLGAGAEPAAATLAWALYTLAKNSEMQTRLRAEIRGAVSPLSGSPAVTAETVEGMPFLNAFVNEVVRYWCPITFSSRLAAVDTVLLGERIPQGTRVVIPNVAANRDAANWGADAGQFRPERWLESGTGGAASNFALMTFLQGPRTCIGSAFGKGEIMTLLIAWVGRFRFELADPALADEQGIVPAGGGSIRPNGSGGLLLKTWVVEGW